MDVITSSFRITPTTLAGERHIFAQGPMMSFHHISRTRMKSRAERWRVRRGPIYRAS